MQRWLADGLAGRIVRAEILIHRLLEIVRAARLEQRIALLAGPGLARQQPIEISGHEFLADDGLPMEPDRHIAAAVA